LRTRVAIIGIGLLPALLGFLSSGSLAAEPLQLAVPLDCDPERECLVQQYVDMAPGPDAVDPFCGSATYDDHKGTDIRVPSLREMEQGVPVVAMARGRVLRLRDGERDRLIRALEERADLNGKECGNGLVVDHGGEWTAQYCHLKNGSISVKPGQMVETGDPLGLVGSSGFAQFPHLHVTVSHSDTVIDPATGREMGSGCVANASEFRPLWSVEARKWLHKARRMIMDVGLAGGIVDHDQLVQKGAPSELKITNAAIVGWGWFANLRVGDQVRVRITEPDGGTLIDTTGEPLARNQASYSQFAGRRRPPHPGAYSVQIEILRDGAVVETRAKQVMVGK